MKNYRITVNDKEYLVKVEEVAEGASVAPSAPAPSAPASGGPSAEGELLRAPIQGSVFRLVAKPGQSLRAGETVLILEAMKLENEIVAPRDGVLEAFLVTEGQTVNADEPLARLK